MSPCGIRIVTDLARSNVVVGTAVASALIRPIVRSSGRLTMPASPLPQHMSQSSTWSWFHHSLYTMSERMSHLEIACWMVPRIGPFRRRRLMRR